MKLQFNIFNTDCITLQPSNNTLVYVYMYIYIVYTAIVLDLLYPVIIIIINCFYLSSLVCQGKIL